MGFHHIGQAGLNLLTSGDVPTLASQSAGISHMARECRGQNRSSWLPGRRACAVSAMMPIVFLAKQKLELSSHPSPPESQGEPEQGQCGDFLLI
ncbi:Podocalyxin [Plecturocebus cupreus]